MKSFWIEEGATKVATASVGTARSASESTARW